MTKQLTLKDVVETIDDLAAMTKRGFDETATKKDLERFATTADMQAGFKQINRRLDEAEEHTRRAHTEQEICRKHRALTDARLLQLEAAI